MDLIRIKTLSMMEEESIVNRYQMRVRFIGNLKLLSEQVREAAARLMEATSTNPGVVLSICVAYI